MPELDDGKPIQEFLKDASAKGFTILTFVEKEGPWAGKKQYSVFKKVGDEEEAYNPILDEWVPGFDPLCLPQLNRSLNAEDWKE